MNPGAKAASMSARAKLAEIEGCPLGKPLTELDVEDAKAEFYTALGKFLGQVNATRMQHINAHNQLEDLIADATARQLRELEGNDGG
jgi:hypothetical protein